MEQGPGKSSKDPEPGKWSRHQFGSKTPLWVMCPAPFLGDLLLVLFDVTSDGPQTADLLIFGELDKLKGVPVWVKRLESQRARVRWWSCEV